LVSPYIHNVIDQTGFGDKWTHIWQNPWKGLLPQEGFDVILDTEKKAIPPFMLKRIPHKLYISAAFRWAFSHKKPKQPYQKPLLLVDRLMVLLNVATDRKITPVYGVEVPTEWKEHAAHLLKDYLGHQKIVLLAPGAGGRFKCWPLENFINLAQKLKEQGIPPMFILGPAESEWKTDIEKHMPDAVFPLQNTDKKSAYLTIGLAQLADVNVANDGGVGHILASSNQPTISMWGPTDPLKSTPNGKQVVVVKSQDFGGDEMVDIPLQAIYDRVINLLQNQEHRPQYSAQL
jgi:ADP-heptose:LPS heptosyltransferase